MNLFYYNFSHDVQLAQGKSLYNPSGIVRALERDMQPLAFYEARKGDGVIVDEKRIDACNKFYFEDKVKFYSLANIPESTICPWGWDFGCLKTFKFLSSAASKQFLPSTTKLDEFRKLSSRIFSVNLLNALQTYFPDDMFCGKAMYCTSVEKVIEGLKTLGNNCVLKAPWSSSGRGIRKASNPLSSQLEKWVLNMLQVQGGVVVEPLYQKESDWAMEFRISEEGNVEYLGLSHFFTDSNQFAYQGNLIAPESFLQKMLANKIGAQTIEIVKRWLIDYFAQQLKGKYVGIFGVDMMVVNENGKLKLHPSVEVNMRRTMGYLSICLSSLLPSGITAKFQMEYIKAERKKLFQKVQPNNLSIDKQLQEGRVLLTPILQDSQFVAYLELI